MVKKITLLVMFLVSMLVSAQTDSLANKETKQSRYAVAVSGSTLGTGVELARSFNEKLSLRLRFNSADLSTLVKGRRVNIGGDPFSFHGGVNFTEFDLSLDYLPFNNSSFKLVGGVAYFTKAKFQLKGKHTKGSSYGEIELDPADIGEVNFSVDYKGAAPYFGIGFGRAIPKNKIGFGFEIGTFYFTQQRVSAVGTNLLQSIGEQEESFKKDISDYRWYPYINLRLAIKL